MEKWGAYIHIDGEDVSYYRYFEFDINDEEYLFTEVITFEEAKKYRKECGTFARAYNWNDLTFNIM